MTHSTTHAHGTDQFFCSSFYLQSAEEGGYRYGGNRIGRWGYRNTLWGDERMFRSLVLLEPRLSFNFLLVDLSWVVVLVQDQQWDG